MNIEILYIFIIYCNNYVFNFNVIYYFLLNVLLKYECMAYLVRCWIKKLIGYLSDWWFYF